MNHVDIDEIVSMFSNPHRVVAAGPSSLQYLASGELVLHPASRLAIPDNLLSLLTRVREGSSEHHAFLIRIMRYFRGRRRHTQDRESSGDNELVFRVVSLILGLRDANRLDVIDDEMIDPKIQESLVRLYPSKAFEISLSPKKNFLREYVVKIWSWSKRTGGLIVERTRRVFSDIGHYISAIQIPDKLDYYTNIKSKFFNRVFNFRGGKATKYFVGIAVAIVGLGNPAAAVTGAATMAGIVIAFTDP